MRHRQAVKASPPRPRAARARERERQFAAAELIDVEADPSLEEDAPEEGVTRELRLVGPAEGLSGPGA